MKNLINTLKIIRLLQVILLLGIFSTVNLFPMHMSESVKTKKLLIFLDDSEKSIAVVGMMLLAGFYQEICPIIASASLVYNLREEVKKDTRPIEAVMNEFSALKDIESIKVFFREKNNALISKIGFQQERWIIKRINDSLVLFIPKSYLESSDTPSNHMEQYHKDLELLSEEELKLGLKVNHMETISIEQIDRQPRLTYFSDDYFIDAMSSIFCTKSDYKNVKMNDPKWIIYIDGHGAINTSIVGLSLNGFQQFLNFLENKIKTQSLIYSSCFGLGVNSDKIFGNMKSPARYQYSFPIIAQGVRDTATTKIPPFVAADLWQKSKEIKLYTHVNFFSLFKIAEKINKGNYKGCMHTNLEGPHNILQIKLPNIEWFSAETIDNKIVSVGSILVKTTKFSKIIRCRFIF